VGSESDIAITARGLTRTFGNLVAVDHVDIDIPRAQIYGFLGPNGSGKSTTIRMLCGLLRPTSGECTVLGLPVPRAAEQLRQRIGYMTQRFSLWEDLTVAENLDFIARIFGIPTSERAKRIRARLDRYGLGDRASQRAGTMSGGQKQKLALAAATLHQPELLLLDEPTSAVDPQSRRDFWESLFDLVDEGATILVSTHYMDEAERCHALAILDQGRIAARGSPRRLMDEIDANVVEVETADPRAARQALDKQAAVLSIAQLGQRLHVLIDKNKAEPAAYIRQLLSTAQSQTRVQQVRANLEDVFVAATIIADARSTGAP
jgi:ABC-2 type transport system ATP-binding protein